MFDFPTIVDISEKGQITIPAKLRRQLGIRPKGKVYLVSDKKRNMLTIKPLRRSIVDELYGKYAHIDTGKKWTKELEEERNRDNTMEEMV